MMKIVVVGYHLDGSPSERHLGTGHSRVRVLSRKKWVFYVDSRRPQLSVLTTLLPTTTSSAT